MFLEKWSKSDNDSSCHLGSSCHRCFVELLSWHLSDAQQWLIVFWVFFLNRPSWYLVSPWIRPHLYLSWSDTGPQSTHGIPPPTSHHSQRAKANGKADPTASEIQLSTVLSFVMKLTCSPRTTDGRFSAWEWQPIHHATLLLSVMWRALLAYSSPCSQQGVVKQHKTLYQHLTLEGIVFKMRLKILRYELHCFSHNKNSRSGEKSEVNAVVQIFAGDTNPTVITT